MVMSPRSCVISCISVTSWYSLWLSVTSDTVSGSELNALKNLSHFLFTVLPAVATELNYQVQSAGHPKTSWASKKFDAFTTIRSAGTAFWHWYHRGSLLSWSVEFNGAFRAFDVAQNCYGHFSLEGLHLYTPRTIQNQHDNSIYRWT